MIVGVLRVDLMVSDARSLKDKRRVLNSIKQRLRDRFHVSVAEVDYQDSRWRAALGVALVSSDERSAHARLDMIVDVFRNHTKLNLLDYQRVMY